MLGSLLSRPVIWHARQQGEQDLEGANTSVCASPAIASQRTQYTIMMLSAFDHRVRVLHDLASAVSHAASTTSGGCSIWHQIYLHTYLSPFHPPIASRFSIPRRIVVARNVKYCIFFAMPLNIHGMGIRLRPGNLAHQWRSKGEMDVRLTLGWK